jgi:hypothetical protein
MRTQECPECRWVPVVDGTGRRRLEMRWVRPGTVTTLAARTGSVVAHAA